MKNKLLISFILFFTILSFFTCCFASSTENYDSVSVKDVEFSNNILIKLPSGFLEKYPYYFYRRSNVFFESSYNSDFFNCYLYFSSSEMFYNNGTLSSSSGIGNYALGVIVSDESNITIDFSFKNLGTSSGTISTLYGDIFGSSSYDIYTDSSKSELVFQMPQVNKVTIPAIQQVEEIPQVMGQVMRILIPIGLIVFSIGLVIYLTRLVISRVQ